MLKTIIASLLRLTICLVAPLAQAQTKINIGYSPTVDFVPLFVAQDQGFLAKHGIEATLTPIAVAANDPPALTSHSIDIGVGTMPTLLLAAENGLDFTIMFKTLPALVTQVIDTRRAAAKLKS